MIILAVDFNPEGKRFVEDSIEDMEA